MKKSLISLLCSLLATLQLSAQHPLELLEKHWEMEMYHEKGVPHARVKIKEVFGFNTTQAAQHAKHSISYGFFAKLSDVEAYTLVPVGGGKMKKVKVTDFRDHSDIDDNIFYDDSRERSFNFPEVNEGAQGHVSYTLTFPDVHLLGSFFFSYGLPVKNASMTLIAPEEFSMDVRLWNGNHLRIDSSITQKKGKTIYFWEAKDLKGLDGVDHAPSPRYYHPHLTFRVKSITRKGKTDDFDGVAGLYRTYYPNIRHIYEEDHPEIRKLVDSIVQGKSDELQKAEAIYSWVQEHLKYVAFEENYRGFRPYSPTKVLNARFGDCKDMSSLLYSMMREAGLPAYMAWIGTRDLPYKYSEWPAHHVDNHMIAVFHRSDTTIYLDGTGSFTPFGYPTSMIQGKEVLIGIDSQQYVLKQVPILSAAANQRIDTLELRWNGKFLEGKGNSMVNGYFKSDYTYLYGFSDAEELRKRLSEYLELGNNSFSVKQAKFMNGARSNTLSRVDFDFTLREYAIPLDQELIVNLNLDKSFLNYRADLKTRELPLEFENNSEIIRHVRFDIPEGYEIKSLPQSTTLNADGFSFELNYVLEGNRVLAQSKLTNRSLLLNSNQLDSFSNFLDELRNTYKQAIILKKKP